jgi:hypothetical protein
MKERCEVRLRLWLTRFVGSRVPRLCRSFACAILPKHHQQACKPSHEQTEVHDHYWLLLPQVEITLQYVMAALLTRAQDGVVEIIHLSTLRTPFDSAPMLRYPSRQCRQAPTLARPPRIIPARSAIWSDARVLPRVIPCLGGESGEFSRAIRDVGNMRAS